MLSQSSPGTPCQNLIMCPNYLGSLVDVAASVNPVNSSDPFYDAAIRLLLTFVFEHQPFERH